MSMVGAEESAGPPDLIVYTDGAASGNPGPAGAAVVVEDGAGRRLHEEGVHLGCQTNNVAEYSALILGLSEAVRLGGQVVEVRSDSELLVRQLEGRYKVKSEHLLPYFTIARRLMALLPRVRVKHVSREANGAADRLARRASRAGAGKTAQGQGESEQEDIR